MLNVIFVKHGTKYTASHVNRLYHQLLQYYPDAKYYCYTDDPTDVKIECIPCFKKPSLKSWWNKLALFSQDFPVKGKCIFFDLDMDIKSDFTHLIQWDGLTLLRDYWKDDKYMVPHTYDVHINSSIITWIAGEQCHIWDHFISNKDYFMRKYAGIDRFIVHENIEFNHFNQGLVNSVANPAQWNAPIDMYNGMDYAPRNGRLYKNALKIIEKIYLDSRHDSDVDLYRILDIMHSINDDQLAEKEWLVNQLVKHLPKPSEKIVILGSWYGLISTMLNDKLGGGIDIENVNSDSYANIIAEKLCKGLVSSHTHFLNRDPSAYMIDEKKLKCFDVVINTSCESMEQEDIDLILALKKTDTLVCFQSNNYDFAQGHINTKASLDDFIESLSLSTTYFSGKKEFDDYDSYMVIGK